MTLCCGILTRETSDCFLRSFCFTKQNGTFSTTEQNSINFLGGLLAIWLEIFQQPKNSSPERERIYICGLGAKIGCERISEHSTFSDESHKYRFFLFLGSVSLACGNSEISHLKQIYHVLHSVPFLCISHQ